MSTSMKHRKKAQASIEFMIFVGIAFLLLIMFSAIITDSLVSFNSQSEHEALQEAVHILHSEIKLASSLSDGYARSFELPPKIRMVNYTITITNNTIVAQTSNFEASRTTVDVSGQPNTGANSLTKQNGQITLN